MKNKNCMELEINNFSYFWKTVGSTIFFMLLIGIVFIVILGLIYWRLNN